MLFRGYMGCISNVWFSPFGLSICSVWIQYFSNESTLFGVVYSVYGLYGNVVQTMISEVKMDVEVSNLMVSGTTGPMVIDSFSECLCCLS